MCINLCYYGHQVSIFLEQVFLFSSARITTSQNLPCFLYTCFWLWVYIYRLNHCFQQNCIKYVAVAARVLITVIAQLTLMQYTLMCIKVTGTQRGHVLYRRLPACWEVPACWGNHSQLKRKLTALCQVLPALL